MTFNWPMIFIYKQCIGNNGQKSIIMFADIELFLLHDNHCPYVVARYLDCMHYRYINRYIRQNNNNNNLRPDFPLAAETGKP